jgi:hypothetical protein
MNHNGPDIYVYKLVTDNGGAPCVFRRRLSLAICKPKIRRSAQPGSLIFGFGAKHHGERLIYVAEVSDNLPDGAYYRNPKCDRRPDCIYKDIGGKAVRKRSARYHSATDERRRDTGSRFERANVLLSDDFRYLGNKGTADYKLKYPSIKACIERLRRGHRRNHSARLRYELLQLKKEIWKRYSKIKIGMPSDAGTFNRCNTDCGSESSCC